MQWLYSVLIVTSVLVLLLVGAGQFGLLAGTAPAQGLGVRDGRFAPPSRTPNSVSSQAHLYPDHPQRDYASIAPLRYSGDGLQAMARLATVLRTMQGTRIVAEQPDYIRAEIQSRWLRFTDDAQFWLDPAEGVIQLRSASRLGRGDLGINRKNMETIRVRFAQND